MNFAILCQLFWRQLLAYPDSGAPPVVLRSFYSHPKPFRVGFNLFIIYGSPLVVAASLTPERLAGAAACLKQDELLSHVSLFPLYFFSSIPIIFLFPPILVFSDHSLTLEEPTFSELVVVYRTAATAASAVLLLILFGFFSSFSHLNILSPASKLPRPHRHEDFRKRSNG